MIQPILLSLMVTSGLIFMQMSHPLAMGLMLLTQTVLVCCASGLISSSFWFSYILFLTFLGGMLVLFIYVTSLASNEMFSLSINLAILSLGLMLTATATTLILDKFTLTSFVENLEMLQNSSMNISYPENTLNVMKLYNFPTNLVTILLVNYLLITLVAVVKITNAFYGPLRHSS